MDAEVLDSLWPDDLERLLRKTAECDAGLKAEQVAIIQAVMRREAWKSDGASRLGDWVAWRLDLSDKTARQLCWAARRLESLPELQVALSAGEITWDQLIPLIRLCRTPDEQSHWLGVARYNTVAQLEGFARRRRRPREEDESEQPMRNSMRLLPDPERGIVDYHGRAVGDDAARLLRAINHIARNELKALAGEERDPWDVRCGDALAILAGATLGGISRDRATINVHLDAEAAATNGASGEASMMPPYDFAVTPSILERLVCDGRRRVVLEKDGVPEAWTHAEHPPPAVEQAVLRRDGHCVIRGCRSRHGEIHHVVWRSRNGATVLSNLVFICWRHHRMIHDRGWQLTGSAGALTWARPDGTVVWSTAPPPRLAA